MREEAFSSHVGLTCVLVLMPLSGVCPVSSFGMLRKGYRALDSFQHRVRTDFQSPSSWGFLVTTCWSKTIQLREMVPPWSPLCPATAITRALSFTSQASPAGLTSLFVSQFTRSASKTFYLPYVFIETSLRTSLPGPASLRLCKPFFP